MIELRQESFVALSDHAKIPIAFTVDSAFDIGTLADGAFLFTARQLESSYLKNYDAIESPEQWRERFDLRRWGLIGAFQGNRRVGGAVIAFDTPEIDLLEGRNDLALIWDIRVSPEVRRQGIGSMLMEKVEKWAVARDCKQLKVETQNNNVAACRFYERCGLELVEVNPGIYRECPDEIQLLWLKALA